MANTIAAPKSLTGPKPAHRLLLALACVLIVFASFRLATTGGGMQAIGAVFAVVGGFMVVRRPVFGIMIFLTTFLFTYPTWLRGVGNFTINNMLGLTLLPLMMYGMLRDGRAWILRWRPIVLLAGVVASMVVSSWFYAPSADVNITPAAQRIQTSRRAQGPALISTRDAEAKFLTRFVFLTFFVFFVRTPRDAKLVAATIIACLLMTYFSVSTGEGEFGWGTGRLRVLGEGGMGVYAGRNPNKLAYFATLCLALLWYARRAVKNPLMYPFWFVATALTFIMIPMTGSRSGMLNLLIFVAVLLLEGRFNYRKVVGLTLITIIVTIQLGFDVSVVDLLFPEDVATRLTRFDVRQEALESGMEAQGSAEGRIRTAQAAMRIFALHPIAGVGIGNFNLERAVTDPFGTIGPPHNSYLWALAEGGIIGFTLYMAMFIWIFRQIREIEWEYEARFGPVGLGWMVAAMRTAMINFLFFSFFGDMWHHVLF
jgi:O-antigen ligase